MGVQPLGKFQQLFVAENFERWHICLSGMLIAPVVYLEPNMMLGVLLYGFTGAVLGGMSSPGGAVAGGFIVGVIENLAGTFIPYFGRELKLTIALLLIVAVLLVKPSGLFGRTVVSRV